MSQHSYSRCWLHLIWCTHERERMLFGSVAARISAFLHDYAEEKQIYLKINFVNPEHVHALIDLPTGKTIEECVKLFKGASSHWINEQKLLLGRFAWARGYGAFSVSHSDIDRVCKYIAGQEEHHRLKTFDEEYTRFVEVYGLVWRNEETVKTVSRAVSRPLDPSLKRGVNETGQSGDPALKRGVNESFTT